MLSEASQRLADDHAALDEMLIQLRKALDTGDVAVSHARLDLFWARLAVHIRAEHLHLFPAVINSLSCTSAEQTFSLTLSEAQTSVERLRADHDFFMHGLAQAIGILRDLLKATDRHDVDDGISTVRDAVLEIEKRLVIHNELEENRIYRWATTNLNEQEQAGLATRINAELANRPPRFSRDAWSNQ
ncbi:MAG: hemerythrin domain-containing protein [Pyrinomonadaceae bacterium]